MATLCPSDVAVQPNRSIGFTSWSSAPSTPVNWFHCVMTWLMISLSARVAMARKNRFARRATYAKAIAITAATAMPNATATMKFMP